MFDRKQKKASKAPGSPAPTAESSSRSKTATPGRPAVIGAGVHITGEIRSTEDILIEGEFRGTVTLDDNDLSIGRNGRVVAEIRAKSVRVDGELQGEVVAQELVVIAETGDVEGNIYAPRVALEDGGRFKGSIDMGGGNEIAATKETESAKGSDASPDTATLENQDAAAGSGKPANAKSNGRGSAKATPGAAGVNSRAG